jgi:hypothetical protein
MEGGKSMKVGDIVRIKADLIYNDTGISKIEEFVGKDTIITSIEGYHWVHLAIDDGCYAWHNRWLDLTPEPSTIENWRDQYAKWKEKNQ